MKKRNIAVFITGWDREVWKLILEGIREQAKAHNFSVSIFNCAGAIDKSRKFDVGEFNIFKLANLDSFDGAIVATNTILAKEVEDELIAGIKQHNIPAISLEIKEDGLGYIGIDNYNAMYKMVEHLADFHRCDRIGFVTGPVQNQESQLRYKAYCDVLKDRGIKIKEEDVYFGTYEYQSGLAAAEHFVGNSSGLPQAIACANDDMAMGLVRGLEKHHIKIPRDIAVTGFDDTEAASNYEPRLSSVERPKRDLCRQACRLLIDSILTGSKLDQVVCETTPIFRESCGCWVKGGKSYKEFRHDYFDEKEITISNSSRLNDMTEKLTESDTFEEMLQNLKNFIPYMKSERLYLCVSPEVNGQPFDMNSPDFMGDLQRYEDEGSIEYPARMEVLAAYKDGDYFEEANFDTKQMLPAEELTEEPAVYLFSPIHFQDRCLGYSIIVNPDFELDGQFFHQWLMNINNSIENIRKRNAVNLALKRLEEMYIRDGLTNLYNRFGFDRFSKDMYEKTRVDKKTMLVLFADLNKLKYINDSFGHESGDIAIKAIAKALINNMKKSDICTRFGGDEFILMGKAYTPEKAEALMKAIDEELADVNKQKDYPFEISVSMGYYLIEEDSKVSLEEAIAIADQRMYAVKKDRSDRV